MTLTFDLWLAFCIIGHPEWTSLLSMVITHGNFTMIRWQEHSVVKMVSQTDWRTDRQVAQTCKDTVLWANRQADGWRDRSVLRAACSQLKIKWTVRHISIRCISPLFTCLPVISAHLNTIRIAIQLQVSNAAGKRCGQPKLQPLVYIAMQPPDHKFKFKFKSFIESRL